MENQEHKEGELTKSIENQTAKLPSDTFLFTAGGVIAISLALKLMKKNNNANFVGQWVAPILLLGIYNKLVKQLGND
jgi:hypothetical protein